MSNPSPNAIDPVIPKSLVDSLKTAFSVQASTPVEITAVGAVDATASRDVDLIAAIGLKSSQFSGTLAICFPSATFLAIVNRMLGESHQEISRENSDAAGELLNIIYASARVKINEGGHDFALAIPTVAGGQNLHISHGGSPKIVRVNCSTDCGPFFLEVSLRRLG